MFFNGVSVLYKGKQLTTTCQIQYFQDQKKRIYLRLNFKEERAGYIQTRLFAPLGRSAILEFTLNVNKTSAPIKKSRNYHEMNDCKIKIEA